MGDGNLPGVGIPRLEVAQGSPCLLVRRIVCHEKLPLNLCFKSIFFKTDGDFEFVVFSENMAETGSVLQSI